MGHAPKISERSCKELIDGYFQGCRELEQHPSLPGLALALGLDSRQELSLITGGSGRAARLVRQAVTRVEEANIQSAYHKDTAASAKFILQNGFGYSEKPAVPDREEIRVEVAQ